MRAHPLRVRRSRQKGSRLPEGTIVVTRGTRWGNPFKVDEHGRDAAVRLYEAWLLQQPDLLDALPDLRGRRLACWCRLNEPCHADVLARLANPTAKDKSGMSAINSRHIRAGLAAAILKPCLCCGHVADVAGCFEPYDSTAYGAQPGQVRLFFYAMCTPCLESTSLEEREAHFDEWRRAA
jgi:hypothetical protein